MADAFRGLTIRLGADARPLNQAINSISNTASVAQKQLNAMNKALKFNPANASAMQERVGLIGNKALLAARAVRDISTAMTQTSAGTKELANKTQNIYAAVHKTRSEYNHVNAELQRVYDSAALVYAGELKNRDATLKHADAMKLAVEHVNELRSAYDRAGEEADQLNDLIKEANSRNLWRMFDTKGEPEKLIGIVKALRAEHKALAGDLSQLKKAEGYSAMKTQLVAWEAELRQAAAETARFRSELATLDAGTGGAVAELTGTLNRIDAELDQATASAQKLDSVFKKFPGDIDIAEAKLRAEAAVQETLNDKVKAHEKILKAIEASPGFDKEAASARNVYKWVSKATDAFEKVAVEVAQAEAKVEAFNAELKEAENANFIGPSRDIKKIKDDLNSAKGEFDEARGKAQRLGEELDKANAHRRYRQTADDLRVLQAEEKKASAAASALHKVLDLSKTFRTMGYGLYSTLTPAIMIAGRYAIQSARDIDAAYRDMRKTVNGTEEEFEHLRDAALEFSTTHFTSAEKILEIEAMGGQLGIAVGDLEEFAEVVSNLDVATNINADEAAEQLGKMATVLGIAREDYDNFGDALVRLGNNMPVMESDILTLTTRFMGMGKVVGMQPDQMLAWAAAASATGQKAEAAGSAMQRFIAKMETAVVGGGESLEQWASVAGMSADEFAQAFGEDASNAMYKFIEGLARIQTEGGSVNQVLQDLKINNVRDKQLLEGLAVQMANAAVSGNVLGDALKMSSDAYHGFATTTKDGKIEEAGDAAREAAKKAEGFSGQIEMMIHDAQLLAQELAVGALPYVKALAEAFKGATEAFKMMPQETKTVIVGLLGVAAAIGPLAVGFGAVGSAVLTFMELWEKALGSRTLAKGAANIAGMTSPMEKLKDTFPKAAKGIEVFTGGLGKAVGTVAKFGPMFAIVAATVAYLGTQIADSAAKHQAYIDTVGKLNAGLAQINPSANGAAGSLKLIGDAARESAVGLDELVKSGSEAIKSIEDRNAAAASEVGSLNAAMLAIEKYGNAGKQLTGAQQGELRAAIDLVNEKCGTQYQILDSLTGKLGDESGAYLANKDAIMQNIAQRQKLVQVQALEANLTTLQAEKQKALKDLILTTDENERTRIYGLIRGYDSAIEATTQMLGDAASAAEGAKLSLGKVVEQTTEFQSYFTAMFSDMASKDIQTPWKSGEEALLAFGTALDGTGLKVEDFANLSYEQMATLTRTWLESGGDMEATLASIGLEAVSLESQFSGACEKIGEDFGSIAGRLETETSTLAAALSEAGISAQQFATFTSDEIATAMAESGGTVEGFIAKLQEIGNQKARVDVETNASEAASDVENLSEDVENIPDGEVDVDYDEVEEADDAVNDLGDDVEDLPGSKDIDVNVYGNARDALSDIYWYLQNINDKTVTVTTEKVEHAAGGFYKLHAAGGFVTNGVTNLGRDRFGVSHIAGEAGREWVMRHADGTTSIVPIENRRYLKPYANTIASMIGGNNSTVINVSLNYDASDDAAALARGVARKLSAIMDMRG